MANSAEPTDSESTPENRWQEEERQRREDNARASALAEANKFAMHGNTASTSVEVTERAEQYYKFLKGTE